MHPKSVVLILLGFLLFNYESHAQFDSQLRNIQINVEMKTLGGVQSGLTQTIHRSNQMQMMVVTEGYEAKLTIGRKVPYAVWFHDYLKEEGYFTGDIQFVHVGTSLVVLPRVVGNQIEVTLTPEISYETGDGTGSIQVSKLSTRVRVPNGQTVEIGSVSSRTEFTSRFYARESGEQVSIRLTPRIMDAF